MTRKAFRSLWKGALTLPARASTAVLATTENALPLVSKTVFNIYENSVDAQQMDPDPETAEGLAVLMEMLFSGVMM